MIGSGEGRMEHRMFSGQRPSTWLALALCALVCVVIGPDLAEACTSIDCGPCPPRHPSSPLPLTKYQIKITNAGFLPLLLTAIAIGLSLKYQRLRLSAAVAFLASIAGCLQAPQVLIFFDSSVCGSNRDLYILNGQYYFDALPLMQWTLFAIAIGWPIAVAVYSSYLTFEKFGEQTSTVDGIGAPAAAYDSV
jgi:hypothetical protein